MRSLVVANPTILSSDIKAHLPEDCDTNTRTIRRRLQKDFGLCAYHPAIIPRLSPKNVKDRLQWLSLISSDESIIKEFYAFSSNVRRPKEERYNQRYTTPRVKSSPGEPYLDMAEAHWFLPPNTGQFHR